MVNLSGFIEVMKANIWKIVLLGAIIIAGNLLFKKLEKRNRRRK